MLKPLTVLFAPGCSISRPSINQRYCCAVSARASSLVLGHLKLPASSRLYASTKPSPSQYSAFTLSLRRPQNRNSVLVNGSSSNFCCTSVARPSIPLRRSVYPTARNTLSAAVKSLSITQRPYYRFCQRCITAAVHLHAGIPQLYTQRRRGRITHWGRNLYKLWFLHRLVHLPLPAVVLSALHAMFSTPRFNRHAAATAVRHQRRPISTSGCRWWQIAEIAPRRQKRGVRRSNNRERQYATRGGKIFLRVLRIGELGVYISESK